MLREPHTCISEPDQVARSRFLAASADRILFVSRGKFLGVFGRAPLARGVTGCSGVALSSGSGVAVPKCRRSGLGPVTQDERVVPCLPSRTRSSSGARVGPELLVDAVADASFQGAHRF